MFAPFLKCVLVLFFPLAVGTGINVENSGNPVGSFQEAKDRVIADLEEGFSRDEFKGYDLNE